ncbi:ATP-binding protein [Candidatus Halobeggiatoa sp. HSG11]|nr:ATP-binding protein [Candidatus Halobeggiatoa sp. HSG11]
MKTKPTNVTHSLTSKLFILFIFAIFVLNNIWSFWLLFQGSEHVLRDLQTKHRHAELNAYIENLENYIADRILLLHRHAQQPILVNGVMNPEQNKASLADFIDSLFFLGHHNYSLSLIDFQGQIIYSNTTNHPPTSFTQQVWFTNLIQGTQQQQISVQPNQDIPSWQFAVPVLYNEFPEGVLMVNFPVDIGFIIHENEAKNLKLSFSYNKQLVTAVGQLNQTSLISEKSLIYPQMKLKLALDDKEFVEYRNYSLQSFILSFLFGSTILLILFAWAGRKLFIVPQEKLLNLSRALEQNNTALQHEIQVRKDSEIALKQAKHQAEQANQAKSRFLATMSHEIRTPVSAMLGMLNLLKTTELDKSQQQFISTAKNTGKSLLNIINDILDFSKVEAGKLELKNDFFDLADTIHNIVVLLTPSASAKGVKISTQIDNKIPKQLYGDVGRLRQVILNLAGNAVKFTHQGRVQIQVTLHTQHSEKMGLQFCIEDSGIGIPAEAQAALFEEFIQLDSSNAREYGGTGLGLAISRSLVVLMEGEIWLESELGKGSRFYFTTYFQIPSSKHLATNSPLSHSNKPIIVKVNKPLLLAEDNPANQLYLSTFLKKAGYDVTVVNNGLQAVEQVKQQQFALILMDLSMPKMGGLEATKSIRALPDDKGKLPIIALTANELDSEKQLCLEAGMDDYLTKTRVAVDSNVLLHKLQEHLGSSTTSKSLDVEVTPVEKQFASLEAIQVPILDLQILHQIELDTSLEVMPQMLQTFISEAKKTTQQITQFAAIGNLTRLQVEAHGLKGSANLFGVLRLHQTLKALDTACKQSQLSVARIHAERIPEQVKEAEFALQQYLEKIRE